MKENMQEVGVVIRSLLSHWCSQKIVTERKKDAGWTMFCVDYCKLNVVTRKKLYPLPRIHSTLDPFFGAQSVWSKDCERFRESGSQR